MPFVKGKMKTPGSGRKKGTLNKRSIELYKIFENFNFDPAEHALRLLSNLEPKDQVEICIKLMPYRYPKRAEPLLPYLEEVYGHSDWTKLSNKELAKLAKEAVKVLEGK